VVAVLLVVAFVCTWFGSTLLLSHLRWFQPRRPLNERLAPYTDRGWVSDDVEAWLER
jgi:hypothetical protein